MHALCVAQKRRHEEGYWTRKRSGCLEKIAKGFHAFLR
jgi:hypothetical protein